MRILLLGILGLLYSGSDVAGSQQLNSIVRNYDKKEYEAANQIWSIASTSDGLTYFANHDGLLEFDGSNWKLYEMPGGLNVRSVFIDANDLIYVGSYEEFGYWRKNEFGQLHYNSLSTEISEAQFHNDEIWRIIVQGDLVYFQSFSEIFVYDGTKVSEIGFPGSLVLLLEADNQLYVHYVNEGLYRIDGVEAHFVEGSEGLASDEIKVILPLESGDLLIGAKTGGLFLFDGSSFESFSSPISKEIRDAELNVGLRQNGIILLGTISSGIYILNESGELIDHIGEHSFLQNNTVLALSGDQAGNIWIGLDAGISYLQLNSQVQLYVNPTVKIGSTYDAALFNGNLFVGTNTGLYRFEQTDRNYINPKLIPGSVGQVWSLREFDNKLICGHSNGTYLVTGDSLRLLSGINGGFHYAQISGPAGEDLIIGTTYHTPVLYEILDGTITEKSHIRGLLEPVPDFVVDYKQEFWAKHVRKGVMRFRLNPELNSIEEQEYLTSRYGLPYSSTVEIVDGQVVFATGEQIFTYDYLNDSILPYDWLNRGLGEYVSSQKIIRAGNRQYWFINNNQIGLFHIDAEVLERTFTIDLDMVGVSLVKQFPNITALSDSTCLMNLEEGFGIVSISGKTLKTLPDLFIRNVAAGNEKTIFSLPNQSPGPEAALKLKNNTIRFTFSSSSHNQGAKFRYRLMGLSPEFSEWDRNTIVEYERLDPGEYIFEVQARDVYGGVSELKVYPFIINQVWYATQGAGMLYALIILLGFWLINKRSRKKISLHESEKREQQRLKAQESYTRLLNEKLAAENSLISIQLANYTQQILHRNELLSNLQKDIQSLRVQDGPDAIHKISSKIGQLIKENESSEQEWEVFEKHFEQAHNNFFKRLLEAYPELTQSDLKLCAFLRMNLSSKEIAPLLNIEIRSVEVRRYRLRKRMHLNTDENLVEYILNI
jgi:ligand-binding sensor domain-containing protein